MVQNSVPVLEEMPIGFSHGFLRKEEEMTISLMLFGEKKCFRTD